MYSQDTVLNLIEDLGEDATTYNIAHALGVSVWKIVDLLAELQHSDFRR